MEIITTDTPSQRAAEELSRVLREHDDKPTLLMLSGGSALSMLDHIDIALCGPHTTITTLDERYSTDPTINNFAKIAATRFFEKAVENGVSTIPTSILEHESLEDAGNRFESALHHWRENNEDGVVIATMGVGADGHTAGIFPHQASFDLDTNNWVVAYVLAPEINPYTARITVTPTFLRTQVNHAIGYLTGESKRIVFDKLQDPDCSPDETSACVMKHISNMTMVTDLHS